MRSAPHSASYSFKDLPAGHQYSYLLTPDRNIHSAPSGSFLKGTIHSTNSSHPKSAPLKSFRTSRPCSSSSFIGPKDPFHPSIPSPRFQIDVGKVIHLVQHTFPAWTSDYLPDLPETDYDLPSITEYHQRKLKQENLRFQWNDTQKRHEVFLQKVMKCKKLHPSVPPFHVTSTHRVSSSSSKPKKYQHISSKLFTKKSSTIPVSSSSPAMTTSTAFTSKRSNPSGPLQNSSTSTSFTPITSMVGNPKQTKKSSPSKSSSRSTRTKLPSDSGPKSTELNLDTDPSIPSVGVPKEDFMAPEGLPLKELRTVMDLYQQYRPEITELNKFNYHQLAKVLKKLPHQRTKQEIQVVVPELLRLKDFKKFSKFFAAELLSVMYLEELNEGTCVFKQGDEGTAWYAILFGAIQIYVSPTGGLNDMKPIRVLTAGSGFGEVALMSNKPRMATVMTISHTVLARVEKEHYSRIMKIAYDQELSVKVSFLSHLPVFEGWTESALRSIGEVMTLKECADGETIVSIGQEVESLFFIKSGQVLCYRPYQQSMVLVAELEPNHYFNENQLTMKEGKAYVASIFVKAKGKVELACIAIQDAKTKFCFDLPMHPMYHYSEKELAFIQERWIAKTKWDRFKKKEMDRLAKETLKNPCTNWHDFVSSRAQRTEKVVKKKGLKLKKGNPVKKICENKEQSTKLK